MQTLCTDFFTRMAVILKQEGVEYNKQLLAELIMKYAPDWRRVLNECQRYSIGNHLNTDVLLGNNSSEYDKLFDYLKDKDFKKMRTWVANNVDVDATAIFRAIYDRMYERVDAGSIPQLVVILADYQFKNAFVADHELNIVACLTEIMANVKIK